jgi:hypothetical protein
MSDGPAPGDHQALGNQFKNEDADPTPPLRYINEGQVASFARTCVQAMCVYIAGRGWVAEDTANLLLTVGAPAVVFVAVTTYGLVKQSDWNILRRAAKVPTVSSVIVTEPRVAASVPSPKVKSVFQ